MCSVEMLTFEQFNVYQTVVQAVLKQLAVNDPEGYKQLISATPEQIAVWLKDPKVVQQQQTLNEGVGDVLNKVWNVIKAHKITSVALALAIITIVAYEYSVDINNIIQTIKQLAPPPGTLGVVSRAYKDYDVKDAIKSAPAVAQDIEDHI